MANFSVDLSGRAAIVTGAGNGIGRAIALALATAGAAIAAVDISPDLAARIARELNDAGGNAYGWQADVANRFQVGSLVEEARDRFGNISILVNAAGVRKLGSFEKLDEWDWRRVLDVNLTGAFFCTQLLGRVMAEEGGGVVVNLATGPATLPEGVGYIASKAGMLGLTRQAARELAPQGIRVNAVCPGAVETVDTPSPDVSRVPQGRLGTPEEVANAVLFLCSDAASFITGQALHIDGGESLG